MWQNITMSKGGAYSLATRGAADVINASIPMIEQGLSGMELRGRTDFSVADMGCADGGTSLQMIETMIEQIRGEAPEIPIKVHYTDQPRNDYNGLIQTVLGLGHFPSYIRKHKIVFQFFSANSFSIRSFPMRAWIFVFPQPRCIGSAANPVI